MKRPGSDGGSTKPGALQIKSYGLFWKRDEVIWGKGRGKKRSILGATSRTSTSDRVEFTSIKSIYALYTETFELVYVGQSGRGDQALGARLAEQRNGHLGERWGRFSWFQVVEDSENANAAQILNHIEAVTIAIAEPRLNRQGGSFGDAIQYYQVAPDLLASLPSSPFTTKDLAVDPIHVGQLGLLET